jgi:O-antigen/teichoic acid export membrane protein
MRAMQAHVAHAEGAGDMGQQWEPGEGVVEIAAAGATYDPIWAGAAQAESSAQTAGELVLDAAAPSVLEGATRRVLFNTLVQTIGKVLGYAFALVTLALTTRLLTTTEYGDYTIATVFLSFFMLVADSGITTAGVREAAKFPEALQRFVDTAFSLKLVLGIVTYAAAAAIISVLPYSSDVKYAAYALALSFFCLSLAVSWDVVFQSRLRMEVPALGDLALKVVSIVGVGAVFWYHLHAHTSQQWLFYLVVGITALGNVAAALVRYVGAARMVKVRLRFDRAAGGVLLRIAVPLAIVSVLGQVHYKADTILLSLLKPADQVAIYGVAYRVVDILIVFFAVLVGVVFPVLARYAHEGGERYTQVVTRVLNTVLSIACPIALGVGLLAPGIVYILGGAGYGKAALPLAILAVSLIFSLLNMFYDYIIIAGNRQASLIWVSCINIAANLGLNLYAIPHYSYIGAAVATCVTEGLGCVLAIVIANRMHRALPSAMGVMRVLVACAAMGLAIVGTERLWHVSSSIASTAVLMAAGGVVYSVVLFAVGGVDPRLRAEVTRRVPVLRKR